MERYFSKTEPFGAAVFSACHQGADAFRCFYMLPNVFKTKFVRPINRKACASNNWQCYGILIENKILYFSAKALSRIDSMHEWPSNCVIIVCVCIGINNIKKHKYLKLYEYQYICYRSCIIDLCIRYTLLTRVISDVTRAVA